ncbi:MAG: hypothetical protein ACPGTU_03185 [Myxococcota bacterium]
MRSMFPILILLTSCTKDVPVGSDPEDEFSPHADGDDDGCEEDSDCSDWQICEDYDCEDGDRNNAFEEAQTIRQGEEERVSDFINVPNDVDYWRYTSGGGEFIRAAIDPHEVAPEGSNQADLFLTLYAPDGSVVTSADDYPNGGSVSNYDSVVYAYLAMAGDYVFEVKDANPMLGNDAWGNSSYSYSMELGTWNQSTWGSDSTFEEPFMFGGDGPLTIAENTWHSVGVLLEEEGEVDYVAIDFEWNNAGLILDGIENLSGSDANPQVALYTSDDILLTSRDQVGPDGPAFFPAMTEGSYIMEVSDADGGGGTNHWFMVFLNAGEPDSMLDEETEPNDVDAQADVFEMTETVNGSDKPFWYGYMQGWVDSPGDTDWFSVGATGDAAGLNDDDEEAQWLVVCMNSARWGSAVAPNISVVSSDGDILAEAEGDMSGEPNLRIENVELTPGESVYLHVDPGPDTLGLPNEWYRIKTYVATFPVTSYEDGGYTCP